MGGKPDEKLLGVAVIKALGISFQHISYQQTNEMSIFVLANT
jgi:hypothetical protein